MLLFLNILYSGCTYLSCLSVIDLCWPMSTLLSEQTRVLNDMHWGQLTYIELEHKSVWSAMYDPVFDRVCLTADTIHHACPRVNRTHWSV